MGGVSKTNSVTIDTNPGTMTDKEKGILIYGYALGLARAAKDDGLFRDMSLQEVAALYLENLI